MRDGVVPYLVQRCKFAKREMSGIDSILSFDYMGSEEFEFGALPKSLGDIRGDIGNYVYFDVKIIEGKVVTVFCPSKIKDKMKDVIEGLAINKFMLKERCDLDIWLNDDKNSWYQSDCWWDLENNFFFWKKNDAFEKEFKERIGGKK